MSKSLYEELQQRRPFASLEHEAQLSIIRTGSMLMDAVEQVLKPHGITATQFNVLRILRGAEPDGLCRYEIRDRMRTRMPDVTRLLDRMEEAGYIARKRSGEDRRMVLTQLTDEGKRILEQANSDVVAGQKSPFKDLREDQLHSLISLLDSVRAAI